MVMVVDKELKLLLVLALTNAVIGQSPLGAVYLALLSSTGITSVEGPKKILNYGFMLDIINFR